MAAITKQADWSQVNSSLWTQYFANAKLATSKDSGLTMVPIHQAENRGLENSSSNYRPNNLKKTQSGNCTHKNQHALDGIEPGAVMQVAHIDTSA